MNNLTETIENELKTLVQNESLPLNERWRRFIEAEKGETDQWFWHPECFNKFKGTVVNSLELALYEHTEPNQIITAKELVDELRNLVGLSFPVARINPITNQQEIVYEKVTKKEIELLKEEILKEFIWSFKFSW